MASRWLILDVSYLCWRVFHSSLKKLAHNEIPTGVMFGFMRDLLSFQQIHFTTNVAFCFDSRDLKRKAINPQYKSSRELARQQETANERKARQGLMDQIVRMRVSFLPDIGFKNIFYADGYEADDIIASLCKNKPEDDEYIVISADADLLQLLTPTVSIWEPRNQRFTTEETFRSAWGIPPRKWAWIKAIAGCNSDDITGVDGVGEKKAAQFLKKEMNRKTPTYAKLIKARKLAKKNLPLVTLPFEGTPDFHLQKDKIDSKVWDEVLGQFGMQSLRNKPPLLNRRGLHG